ncbi:hypothetical protein Bealeia1_00803 [Candidatus Bealeia paramacronuclearis]|uniref:Rap1a immunity protein domain-containing protein n=1 Tax=Candidatus Bealeia paramacronuclearis TaxID=1921001 RepID=A0ABZ2C2E1_9PROT|nr:hypothetical protein [Candidatus Bealeia paramacronuclearis]
MTQGIKKVQNGKLLENKSRKLKDRIRKLFVYQRWILTWAGLTTCHALQAESVTNKDLLAACQNPGVASQNFCYGFIVSASNAAQFYRNIMDVEDSYVDICFPENISNQDIVKLYLEWGKKNPSLAQGPAFIGVSTSFSTKYSCPKKK